MAKQSETATLKAKFRKSVAWREFRKQKMLEQKGLDPITKRKLSKHYICHHVLQTNDLNIYRDLSDPSKFVAVNSSTHDSIHWALNLIFRNGFDAWDRFIDEVEREAILNDYLR